jgi:hypothetical protein
MITKQQWAYFCFAVQDAKYHRYEPFIQGKRVIEVDVYKNTITTSLAGQSRTVFKHDSCGERSLKEIYKSVELTRVTLADMKYAKV